MASGMTPRYKALILQAYGQYQRSQFAPAEKLCHQLIQTDATQADAYKLLGLILKSTGRIAEALTLFYKCLQINPEQIDVLSNIGNILLGEHKHKEAISIYRRAIALDSGFVNAWYNLSVGLFETGQFHEAISATDEVLKRIPNHVGALDIVALSLTKIGQIELAHQAYDKLLSIEPRSSRLWYNFGNFCRDQYEFDDAVLAYQKAIDLGLSTPQVYENLAAVYNDSGDTGKAIDCYERGLIMLPGNPRLYYERTKFLWEATGDEGCDKLLVDSISRKPDDSALWGVFFEWLAHQGRFAEIMEKMDQAKRHCAWTPKLSLTEAIACSALDNAAAASLIFEQLLRADPESSQLKLAFAEHCLKVGDFRRAEKLCLEITQADVYNQLAWALCGTAWRMMHDARADWLNNYETMIRSCEIPVPGAWSDLPGFLADVYGELDKLHGMQRHPLEQTLRQGTQTNGFLFRTKSVAIRALQQSIEAASEQIIGAFPKDAAHPLWARTQSKVKLVGAWSVKLRNQGFHTNHIHPQGWLSSALYIALPEVIAGTNSDAGYIQFGVPPVELGLPQAEVKLIKPKPGMLVLFPSYMWHGTIPFTSTQPRVTVAFDLLPA